MVGCKEFANYFCSLKNYYGYFLYDVLCNDAKSHSTAQIVTKFFFVMNWIEVVYPTTLHKIPATLNAHPIIFNHHSLQSLPFIYSPSVFTPLHSHFITLLHFFHSYQNSTIPEGTLKEVVSGVLEEVQKEVGIMFYSKMTASINKKLNERKSSKKIKRKQLVRE